MKIIKLYCTGYKNLVDCTIQPQGIHAITGCNGTGKSNLLEVLPFVAGLLTGSDTFRNRIINGGVCPNDGIWFPLKSETTVGTFNMLLDVMLEIGTKEWSVQYEIKIKLPKTQGYIIPTEPDGRITSERLTAKPIGTPGRAVTFVKRDENGRTFVTYEGKLKKREIFNTKPDMSALQAIEVRQADDFSKKFPVIHNFYRALLASSLLDLDAQQFRDQVNTISTTTTPPNSLITMKEPGDIIKSFDPYSHLEGIKNEPERWKDMNYWLKMIAGIDWIDIDEMKATEGKTPDQAERVYKIIFTGQHGRTQGPGLLSMGGNVVLAFLVTIFSLVDSGGVVLIEEPENHLHPQAVMNLIRFFREFSDRCNIIFSTHNPVVLNELQPNEVTVMEVLPDGFVTTRTVADIAEAIASLNRGFNSLGDLLQTNFAS